MRLSTCFGACSPPSQRCVLSFFCDSERQGPNIIFCHSVETFISKVCESRGGGIMVTSEWLFLFLITDKWAVDRMEGRERESERRNNRERSLLRYSDYIRPSWQTMVLVHNSEWLSEWPEGVWYPHQNAKYFLCMKTKLVKSVYYDDWLCHILLVSVSQWTFPALHSVQHVCNRKRMDLGPLIAHL